MTDKESAIETIMEWSKNNTDIVDPLGSLFMGRLLDRGFSSSQIVKILEVIDTTCRYCWDGDVNHNCSNEE